jgi:hypothetical protein
MFLAGMEMGGLENYDAIGERDYALPIAVSFNK